jgi:hypothetical protein
VGVVGSELGCQLANFCDGRQMTTAHATETTPTQREVTNDAVSACVRTDIVVSVINTLNFTFDNLKYRSLFLLHPGTITISIRRDDGVTLTSDAGVRRLSTRDCF